MRFEEYMKGILGALGVVEDNGVPDPVWNHEVYLKAIYEAIKAGGAGLPPVTPDDDGKVLAVEDGAWAARDEEFIVTLTPTATDLSGTMNKTPQEITEAFNAGMKVVFDIPSLAARVDADQYLDSGANIQCGAKVFYEVGGDPVLVTIATSGADDGQDYYARIYPLTYPSAQGVNF